MMLSRPLPVLGSSDGWEKAPADAGQRSPKGGSLGPLDGLYNWQPQQWQTDASGRGDPLAQLFAQPLAGVRRPEPPAASPLREPAAPPPIPTRFLEEPKASATSPPPARAPPPPPAIPELHLGASAWAPDAGDETPSTQPGRPTVLNYKGELNHIAQHVLKQPLTAKDVVFTAEAGADGFFRCCVKLPWYDGRAFPSSEAFLRKKDAEQRAAEVAVRHLVSEGVAPPETALALPPRGLSPRAEARLLGERAGPPGSKSNDNDRSNAKGDLNNLAMKLLKRPVADGDVVYCSQLLEARGVYVSSLRLAWWTNWSFCSLPCTKKKDAEQLTAGLAAEALASALRTQERADAQRRRDPDRRFQDRPERALDKHRCSFRALVQRFVQVCSSAGEITWRGRVVDSRVEVALTVPWVWSGAPDGTLRFVAHENSATSSQKAGEALAALHEHYAPPNRVERVVDSESEASGEVETSQDGEMSGKSRDSGASDETTDLLAAPPGTYARLLPVLLQLTDPHEESAGEIAYTISEREGGVLAASVTWPSPYGEFLGAPRPGVLEAEAAVAEVVCRHLLARIPPKERRAWKPTSGAGAAAEMLPRLAEMVLARPLLDEDICSSVTQSHADGAYVGRITLPWWSRLG